MPDQVQSILFNDFSAGWVPSDSPENGRKNGLLKMDNVELDKNGVLTLVGGTSKVGSAYTNPAINIWSRSMAGSRVDYLACTDGVIYRNGTTIVTGGSTSRMAFGDAYKYVLMASGTKRKKDTGSGTPINLGILKPTVECGLDNILSPQCLATGVPATNDLFIDPVGTTNFGVYPFEQTCDGADNQNVIQTLTTPTYHGPYDMGETHYSTLTLPPDAEDFLNSVTVTTTGFFADLTVVLDYMLDDPGGSGDGVANYYRAAFGPGFWTFPLTGNQFNIRRGDFERVGTSNSDWTKVYGIRITCISNVSTDVVTVDFSRTFTGGFDGSRQYMQVNVNSNGSYIGKSELGPVSNIYLDNQLVDVTPQDPTSVDAQCNEAWIFRRGGLLEKWYRVKAVTAPFAAFTDILTDVEALTLNITYNNNLTSVNSASLAADILSIVGPVEGRWFYFTADTMYPSDINNPDLIDTTKGVSFSNANNEVFLWANRVSDEAVMVGTTLEVYLLTGTFQTLPDFTIDVYKRGLGCKHPPITIDSTFYDGSAIYLAADGWRSIGTNGVSVSLNATNTDRLYRGETVQGYLSLSPGVVPGSLRYPCAVINNHLWCGIAGTNRIEVLDLTRKYWYNINYGVGTPRVITKSSDGYVLSQFDGSGFGAGIFLRDINLRSSGQIDGASDQTVTILTPVLSGELLRNRKDALTFKARVRTNNNLLNVMVIDDTGTATNIGNISATGVTPLLQMLDSTTVPVSKTFQFALTGSFSVFELTDITLDFEARPVQLTSYISRPSNYGSAGKKRSRQWPVVMDSLGNNVVFTPRVDGVNLTSVTLNSNEKKTLIPTFDAFGVDIGAILSGGPFELYDIGNPDILESQPVARKFDRIGGPGGSPIDLFRYGQVSMIRARLNSQGTTLPYTVYMNDRNVANGSFNCIIGEDNHYEIPLPKGTAGTNLSIELGDPALAFTFQRFYVQVLVELQGKDTQKTWITVGGSGE